MAIQLSSVMETEVRGIVVPGEWERGRWAKVSEASEEVAFDIDLKGFIGHQPVKNEHFRQRKEIKQNDRSA